MSPGILDYMEYSSLIIEGGNAIFALKVIIFLYSLLPIILVTFHFLRVLH